MELHDKAQTPYMFNRIAKRYDLINRILSFGLDYFWRQSLIRLLPQHKGLHVLDAAAGTGDQTLALIHSPRVASVVALDPSHEMLAIAKRKVKARQPKKQVEFERAHVEQIPFLDGRFDIVTMSFGIRNVPDVQVALKELYRVLKPAGQIFILEFSSPTNPVVRFFYRLVLRTYVPFVGGLLSGSREAYRYLDTSIEAFPSGAAFCAELHEAGFDAATAFPLFFGVVTIYTAKR